MNRLASENSPYLLQHAGNPVNWFSWGDEAFAAARRDDKPIFLSIGYSTCHWCHVMAHESFESPAIAELLNRDFVAIKVDREERPDVDRVYMLFVQASTGSGGWPMSVWLTPDLKPFHGGTYYPPDSRWGRPGFVEILEEIARVWRSDRAGIEASASAILERLRPPAATGRIDKVPGVDALIEAVQQFREAFDSVRGGFGGAPKFPRPSELLFLLQEARRSGDVSARDMAVSTLEAIASGGMRDHVGGGFHRYSVDSAWRVPHFEKMLYDQAQLVMAFLDAATITGMETLAAVAEDTLEYVARDMSAPDGGFYSAEDADSLSPAHAHDPMAHKAEGAFYLWDFDEVGSLLGEDAELVRARFGMRPDGNAPMDPQDEFGSGNLLYEARTIPDLSRDFNLDASAVAERLTSARTVMMDARRRRPRPHVDDKILTAWNSLMIAAFARGAVVLHRPDYLALAERAASFVRDRMWRADDRALFRRCRKGDVGIRGFAEDYAAATWGALELSEAGAEAEWLEWALTLQRRQDELFLDRQGTAWFSTSGADRSIVLRLKEAYDGAEPSAGSVAVRNLLALARLTGDASWRSRAEVALGAAGDALVGMSRAVPMMLANLSVYHSN